MLQPAAKFSSAARALGSARRPGHLRSREVGFIFQAFYLLPTLRAIENGAGVDAADKTGRRTTRAQRAKALLCEMGLEHRTNQFPNELSAGGAAAVWQLRERWQTSRHSAGR